MRFIFAIFVSVFSAAGQAATVTLEFSEYVDSNAVSSYAENGYVITGDTIRSIGPSLAIFGTDQDTQYTLSRADGGLFTLYNFDVQAFGGGPVPLSFGQNTYDINRSYGLNVSPAEWTTVNPLQDYEGYYAPLFVNVSSVKFSLSDPGVILLDNIVVSAVPVPAAVWLFGSALVGLGWLRRKQTV